MEPVGNIHFSSKNECMRENDLFCSGARETDVCFPYRTLGPQGSLIRWGKNKGGRAHKKNIRLEQGVCDCF